MGANVNFWANLNEKSDLHAGFKYYELQRRRGKKHHAAVRALAFKWIRIIFRCWKERVVYDENVNLAALAKHNSPLLAATKIGVVRRAV